MTLFFVDDPGFDDHLHVYTLKRNYQMLLRNYAEVQDIFKICEDRNVFERFWKEDVDVLDNFIYDFSRRMINFISMSKAVVDVTRALINECLKDTDFLGLYQEKVKKQFSNKPLVKFIEDMRNYALHYRLPIPNLQFPAYPASSANKELNRYRFVFVTSRLLEWENWSPNAKIFLRKQDRYIDVECLFGEYFALVSDFYNWMFDALKNY